MVEIQAKLNELGFIEPYSVQGRASIADLFRPKQRCGIYILLFENDEIYIGQAINVVRRYAQHKHNHTDIRYISFKRIIQKNLTEIEKMTIQILEQDGFKLRNIDLVTFSYGNTDFDLIMSRDEQEKWLDDPEFQDVAGERVINQVLRGKYARRFSAFKALPLSNEAMRFVSEYVRNLIPAVKRGEISFWNCSVMPSAYRSKLYIRINVGWQTVLDFFVIDSQPVVRFYLTRHLTEQLFQEALPRLENDDYFYDLTTDEGLQGRIWIANSSLIKGGGDQVCIDVENLELAYWLLKDPAIIAAIRIFNLGLVQKSPCPWGKNHCLDLADCLIHPNLIV